MLDVVVLNYNDAETTTEFVNMVRPYACVGHIAVVDNASTDDSATVLARLEDEKVDLVRSEKNGGYGAGNNLGIRYLHDTYDSRWILLANPDVIVEEAVLLELENFLSDHPDYALAAPFMYNAKGEPQRNTAFPLPGKWQYIFSFEMVYRKFSRAISYRKPEKWTEPFRQVDAVSGSMFLMDAEKMLRGGMYDENIFLYCEELTLGLRLRKAGYKTALLPRIHFIHNHSVSISKSISSEIRRYRLQTVSKLYVLRTYYGVRGLAYALALIAAKLSVAETWLNERVRNR